MRYKFYFNLKKKIEKELCLRKIRNLLRSLEESEACLSILWIASKATKASVEIESALFSGVTTCHHPFDEFIFCCARDFLRILHSIIEKLVKLYQHTVTCIKGNSYILTATSVETESVFVSGVTTRHHPWEFVRFKTICADFSPLNSLLILKNLTSF